MKLLFLVFFTSFVVLSSSFLIPGQLGNVPRVPTLWMTRKTFYVSRTIKSVDGTIKESLVKCSCKNDKEFNAVRKRIGDLVDTSGRMLINYNDVRNNTSYDVTLDGNTMQATITNLLGNSLTISRSAELQVRRVYALIIMS